MPYQRRMRSFADATKVLGQLELKLMRVLWDSREPLAVRDVIRLIEPTGLAYTTVMTTLDRLYKKGLLVRDKSGTAFVYRAAMDHDKYQRQIVAAAVQPLLESAASQGASSVLAAFVEVAAGVDEHHLDELTRLIAARRKRR